MKRIVKFGLTISCSLGLSTIATADEPMITVTVKHLERGLTTARKSFGAAYLDERILIAGGHGGTRHSTEPEKLLRSSEWFDPKGTNHDEASDLPLQIYGFEMVPFTANFIYVLGGISFRYEKTPDGDREGDELPVLRYSSAAILRYNLESEAWSEVKEATLPHPRSSHIVKRLGNLAYAIGGWDFRGPGWGRQGEGVYLDPIDIVDLKTVKTTTAPYTLPPPQRRGFCGESTDDGRIIMAGGMMPNPDGSPHPATTTNVTVLTPANAESPWSELPPLPIGLFGAGCAIANGLFLVIGGAALDEEGMLYQKTVYGLDLKDPTAQWQVLAELNEFKGFVQAVTVEEKVYVLGGIKVENASDVAGPNDAVEIIEVVRNR